jgi:hypothetical protein
MKITQLLVLCGLVSPVLLIGCSTLKSDPAENSSFLEDSHKMTEQRERLPFHKAWVKSNINRKQYSEIMIAPVNTDYLIKNNGWSAMNLKEDRLTTDARAIAAYTVKTYKEALLSDANTKLNLVSHPSSHTLELELAIVELVPSKAAAGAVGLITMPIGMIAGTVATKVLGKGAIAIEGRLVDAKTREVIAMFADREKTKTAPIDLAAATWYRGIEVIIQDWADQTVEIINTPRTHKVEDTSFFTLMPW